MTSQNTRAPVLCYVKFVHYFKAICEFKLELQSGNAQIGAKFILTSVTLTFDLWPWPFAWVLLLSMVITSANLMVIRWQEHCEKGMTDGRTDGRTESGVRRAARSQLKLMTYQTLFLQHHSNILTPGTTLGTPAIIFTWRHRSWCLTALCHYLNQWWLIINGILWHVPYSSFTWPTQAFNP